MKGGSQDNIKVFIRIRPLNQKQQLANTGTCINPQSYDEKTINLNNDKQEKQQFSFDHIFNMKTLQEEVYQKVGKDVVKSAFQGFNGTIFAYGQTSSGKTHTCIGPDYEDKQLRGILPRLIDDIFTTISQSASHIQFRIKISMVEIYLQKIKDLFDSSKTDIKIRQSKAKGLYMQDVTQQYVASSQQTIKLMKKGIGNRSTGHTNMNEVSSRSHMAFIITLYQNNLKDSSAKSGKIILVDLAGSQKVGKTGAQGKLLDQAKNINKSLSALGNVIFALTQQRATHIPYRDSKLTRLLQQSLGGNSRTNLIINVSPSNLNQAQTLSSLRFGFRAKQIKNKPKVNRQYTVAQLLVLLQKSQKKNQELQQIIKDLTTSANKRKTIRKQTPAFIQNLLDSDNPIPVSNTQDNEDTVQNFIKKQNGVIIQQISAIKEQQSLISSPQKQLRFETQFNSDEDLDQTQLQLKRMSKSNKSKPKKEKSQSNQQFEEKSLLLQQIQNIINQKTNIQRQYQIYKEKYDIILKQSKIINHKFNSQQKQNQKLIEKFISEQLQSQQKQIKLMELREKVQTYQDAIASLAALKKDAKSNFQKVFGGQSTNQAQKIIQKALNIKKISQQKQQFDYSKSYEQTQLQQKQNQHKKLIQSNKRIKQLQQQIVLFKHLENSKEAFIKQKVQFTKQRQRIYEDLQNRIQKVLELQEKLDQQKDKNKNYAQIIDSDESQKGRKILSLQRHLAQVSQNYYVLKGQQSSWVNNNKKIQNKLETKTKKILDLQNQILSLKQQLELSRIRNQQIEDDNKSIIDLDLELRQNQNQNQKKQAKIVKVLRSSIYNSVS